MLTISKMQEILADRNMSEVARRAKISASTVRNVVLGNTDNLTIASMQKLSDYLEGKLPKKEV